MHFCTHSNYILKFLPEMSKAIALLRAVREYKVSFWSYKNPDY